VGGGAAAAIAFCDFAATALSLPLAKAKKILSLEWGLNPRPFAYEANALPLS
jgi:hypothetical protein